MAGTKTWVRNADVVVTMDGDRSEPANADILVEGGRIASVGAGHPDDPAGWEVIDAAGCVVTPALVNTHHHLYQTLTRAVPAGQDALLFGWLKALYPLWARMRPEDMFASAQLGLAELALSGCGTSSDHLYIFPDGVRLEDTIEAAAGIGLRFHATRGAMSVGESAGGLPPDSLVEREADILEDCIRVIDAFHDPCRGRDGPDRHRALLALLGSRANSCATPPCSPPTRACACTPTSRRTPRTSPSRSRRFGCRPGDYAEELGWVGEHVWHAHCTALDEAEISLFARTGTGVAHCPSSNCRLGSGIAPVRAMLDAGVPLGLGVDGSASNDSGSLLPEARQAMLLQRVRNGAAAMSAREALEMATRGGARLLGRAGEIGSLETGRRADLAVWDVSGLAAAGAWDPVAALVLCGPFPVRDLLVEGRPVVRDGTLTRVDAAGIAEAARRHAARLAS